MNSSFNISPLEIAIKNNDCKLVVTFDENHLLIVDIAIKYDTVDVFSYFCDNYGYNERWLDRVIERDSIQIFDLLFRSGFEMETEELFQYAIECNSLKIAKYLTDHKLVKNCSGAVPKSAESLKLLLTLEGYEFTPSISELVAEEDNIDILKAASSRGIVLSPKLFNIFLKKSYLDTLNWLVEIGNPMDDTMKHEIVNFRPSSILWYLKKGYILPSDILLKNCRYICMDSIIILKHYSYEWSHEVYINLIRDNREVTSIVNSLSSDYSILQSCSLIEKMNWFHKKGCPLNSDVTDCIAATGNIILIKWAVEKKLNMKLSGILVTQSGYLQSLQWLVENGHYRPDEQDLACARLFGHTSCSKYLLSRV